jgi:hypothetical protein
MTYLVDVNVLSEPTKQQAHSRVLEWLVAHRSELVVDPVVMGEVWEGIVSLPPGRRRTSLEVWFRDRRAAVTCLDWTLATAIVWAELRDEIRRHGFTVPMKDTMIAATAKLHGLTVATRDVTDFLRCGVPVINPFEPA